jgi:hypothetical protein
MSWFLLYISLGSRDRHWRQRGRVRKWERWLMSGYWWGEVYCVRERQDHERDIDLT